MSATQDDHPGRYDDGHGLAVCFQAPFNDASSPRPITTFLALFLLRVLLFSARMRTQSRKRKRNEDVSSDGHHVHRRLLVKRTNYKCQHRRQVLSLVNAGGQSSV